METPNKKNLLNAINAALNAVHSNQREKASYIFRNELQVLPDDPELAIRYGILCKLLGEREIAIKKLCAILAQKPDDLETLNLLGSILIDDGQYQEAEDCLGKAIAINPRQWQTLLNLGIADLALEKYDEALSLLEQAQSLKPGEADIHENLANCMMKTERPQEALEHARKAVKLDPKNYNANITLGLILANTGNLDEGIKYMEKSIKLDMLNPVAYMNLALMKKFSAHDSNMIAKIEKILAGNMHASDRSRFCYTLGRIYDDCKEWDKAFSYIKQANLLASTTRQENPAPKKHLQSLRRTYHREMFEKYRALGNQSEIPVFIIGMPRSGTSLLEQIISSHPDAAGAGEITVMGTLLKPLGPTDDPAKYQARVKGILNEQSLHELANAYLEKLRRNRETARRITDKNTSNYFYLGLIALLFPNANIIHVSRSPLDTCISCYFQYFAGRTAGWSFDPQWITNTYRTYRQTMEFWESVLPENKILDVQYERLIEDPEHQVRRIIEFCKLDWHPACLEYYNTSSVVLTASLGQVRQPIYKKAVQRWKNYGANIEVFARGLHEYLDESDKEYLSCLGIRPEPKKWWIFSK